MNAPLPPAQRARDAIGAVAHSPLSLLIAFILVTAWLAMLNLYGPANPMGDVSYVYHFWVDQALVNDFWVGIDSRWVYPIVALVPMLFAMVFGPEFYSGTWLLIVAMLNLVALGTLTSWGRSRENYGIAWWWLLFLLLLGPVALGRIDAVSVPLALVGVLVLANRPRLAAVLLTTATWIKVWPAAVLAAIVLAVRTRLRVAAVAVTLSIGIVGVVALFGGIDYVFSFVVEQSNRGLQVEAPVSTVWLWLAAAGQPDTFVYYDQDILTFQVQGPGAAIAAAVMTPVLALAALAIGVIAALAVRKGIAASVVLSPLMLALVTAFIVVNKVGSPQFETWLAVPIVFGLVAAQHGGTSFRVPAALGLVIAGLTQIVYPYFYDSLLRLEPAVLVTLTARNLLLIVLLAWALNQLVRGARGPVHLAALETDPVPIKKVVS